MSSYRKGYRFEKRVQKHLQSKGWTVFRQGKSAFPDLICLKQSASIITLVKLVECKTNRRNFSRDERERLTRLSRETGAESYLAYKEDHKIMFEGIG